MEDRWLYVDEIGEYLGVKHDTVYRWISERDRVDGWGRSSGPYASEKPNV
ncbi:hypothetical protein GCM10010082_04590 [Kushneria pakistanensis]|uniref:Helix-turn-helix domain-containing protein n=1 Tax=Kushneria pakistanensis TaxID=1508770 RepID=A0ABQ3FB71_9GAMM|nr:hypothetical protein GCM10010082_04590 [Kushneria pakistanensis]